MIVWYEQGYVYNLCQVLWLDEDVFAHSLVNFLLTVLTVFKCQDYPFVRIYTVCKNIFFIVFVYFKQLFDKDLYKSGYIVFFIMFGHENMDLNYIYKQKIH